MWAKPTLFTNILKSKFFTLFVISSNKEWLYSEKSALQITVCNWGYFAQSYLLRFYNLAELRDTSTKLNPRDANSKQKAFPIPSVHPVTIAQDPLPYVLAHD